MTESSDAAGAEAEELDFDWSGPNALGPEYLPRLQRIQARAPVFWSASRQAWLITRHQDVAKAFMDPRLSNHRLHFELERQLGDDLKHRYPHYYKAIVHWIFNSDGTRHARLRKLMFKPFDASPIGLMRPIAQRIVDEVIDQCRALSHC